MLSGYLSAMDNNRLRMLRRRRVTSLSAVCFLMAITVGVWLQNPAWIQNFSADEIAGKGVRRSLVLADGSTALLDAGSALSVDFKDGIRRIHLLRGAAWFDVIPSATPFVVETEAGSVRVLGTQFDVRLQDSATLVTLARGSVAVTSKGQSQPTLIKPGQQVRFTPQGVSVPSVVNLQDALAWRDGRYIFYRARLGDVVREVERYRTGRILITSSSLADQQVTGSFSLAEPDKALDSLQASIGFSMYKVTDYLIVIR
ncbi:MAG: Protein FecR [Candidatus Erwinia impunctatus]|nr:Protein FecR [Culicoides impunctatus]